jgi:hypothetical protein
MCNGSLAVVSSPDVHALSHPSVPARFYRCVLICTMCYVNKRLGFRRRIFFIVTFDMSSRGTAVGFCQVQNDQIKSRYSSTYPPTPYRIAADRTVQCNRVLVLIHSLNNTRLVLYYQILVHLRSRL